MMLDNKTENSEIRFPGFEITPADFILAVFGSIIITSLGFTK
jgi:hypothetical protein